MTRGDHAGAPRGAKSWHWKRLLGGILLSGAVIALVIACHKESGPVVKHSEVPADVIPQMQAVELAKNTKLRVVASTSIIGDVTANIGGADIDLTVLMGYGQDPHSYEPTPSALARVERANIVFVNGYGLEEVLLNSISTTATGYVVPVSVGIKTRSAETDVHAADAGASAHEHGVVDPHVWLDPTNVLVWTDNIVYALSTADPAHTEDYRTRGQAYRDELTSLDKSMREQFAQIPVDRRRLVTDHELFGYFAEEYGFDYVGALVPSPTTSAESSARQIAALVDVLKREGIRTIFIGATASKGTLDLAATVRSELGESIRIVEVLTGSLTPPGTPGSTYIGYMKYNTSQIVDGLMQTKAGPH